MLSKKRRLSRELIRKTLREGKGAHGQNVSLKYLAAPLKSSAFAFIVSAKKIKSAVFRNKVKRRGRAIIFKILPRLKEGYAVLFFFKEKSHKTKFSELETEMKKLLQGQGLFKTNL